MPFLLRISKNRAGLSLFSRKGLAIWDQNMTNFGGTSEQISRIDVRKKMHFSKPSPSTDSGTMMAVMAVTMVNWLEPKRAWIFQLKTMQDFPIVPPFFGECPTTFGHFDPPQMAISKPRAKLGISLQQELRIKLCRIMRDPRHLFWIEILGICLGPILQILIREISERSRHIMTWTVDWIEHPIKNGWFRGSPI